MPVSFRAAPAPPMKSNPPPSPNHLRRALCRDRTARSRQPAFEIEKCCCPMCPFHLFTQRGTWHRPDFTSGRPDSAKPPAWGPGSPGRTPRSRARTMVSGLAQPGAADGCAPAPRAARRPHPSRPRSDAGIPLSGP